MLNPLSLIPTAWLWPFAGAVGLAMAGAIGVQTLRVSSAQAELAKVQQAWDKERADRTQAALTATAASRAEDQRRTAAQLEITNENERLAARIRDAAMRSAVAGVGLRQRAAPLAAACDRAAGDPAPAGERTPAPGAGTVLANVLGRTIEAARQLAAEADKRGPAGSSCEHRYDSLTPPRGSQ